MCGAADNSSSGDDEESDVQDQQKETASTSTTTDTDVSAPVDNCEVCLVASNDPRIALVPFGHIRFCGPCGQVHSRPVCRTRSPINMLLRCVCINCDNMNTHDFV